MTRDDEPTGGNAGPWMRCLAIPNSVQRELDASQEDQLLEEIRRGIRLELGAIRKWQGDEKESGPSDRTEIDEDGSSSWSQQTTAKILATSRRKAKRKP